MNQHLPLHEQLRRQILGQIKDAGLREAMLREYQEMAGTVSALLALLGSHGVPESLPEAARGRYGECMARLTQSGMRCQLLAQESIQVDNALHLAATDARSGRVQ